MIKDWSIAHGAHTCDTSAQQVEATCDSQAIKAMGVRRGWRDRHIIGMEERWPGPLKEQAYLDQAVVPAGSWKKELISSHSIDTRAFVGRAK